MEVSATFCHFVVVQLAAIAGGFGRLSPQC